MQKNYFLLIVLLSFAATAQIVNIPDTHLKARLLAYTPAIDTNSDGQIQLSEAQAVTTLNLDELTYVADATGIGAFTNLTNLTFNVSDVTTFDFSSLTNLESLTMHNNYHLPVLDVSGLTSLQYLDCTANNFDGLVLNGLTSLTDLKCYTNHLTSLILTDVSNLTNLSCDNNYLTSLWVGNLAQLQNLSCANNRLTALDVAGLSNLVTLSCSLNYFITALNVGGLTNLTSLSCNDNAITSLTVNTLTNLTALSCGNNPLGSLNVTGLTHLLQLDCHNAQLTTLDLSTLNNLTYLSCGQNPINTLNVSNLTHLTNLTCDNNNLTALDITALPDLAWLICNNNQLSAIDLSHNTHLVICKFGANLFTTLDLSHIAIPLDTAAFFFTGNPNLTYLNLKFGGPLNSSFYLDLSWCPNLAYICANENNLQQVANSATFAGPNVQVNSYCTFVPGGTNNTIAGTVTFDANNNGCDAADAHFRNVKVGINDGTVAGAAFSNTSGNYSFYTQSGNFTLTPVFENPYFTISPASATLNFPTVNSSTQTQNFCITPLGIHNDVEITLWTFGNGPGFDQQFYLTYKNKGNQIQSGTINFTFDDSILDFVSAAPMTSSQTTNNLNWDYSNLQPFESRSISFKLNLHGPTETPPVSINDILHYTATVNPVAGDETPLDNVFAINHTVSGSYDPNDKSCMEGTTMLPERIGDYLHYVIRFQNSGTAAAQNIVVKDIIDTTKFDIASLQLTDSSHPQVTKITGNKVEFVFENINLPNESADEAASHGYVAFKIKTKNNLVLGNVVSNKADIYFDYNFPITTNTAATVVALLATNSFEDKTVAVFPNPVKDKLTIAAKDKITSVQLYDIQGRLIETAVANDTNFAFDLAKNAGGVYFVKIYTSNGMKVEKIIKE